MEGTTLITFKLVTEKERELLWNINQKYLYEMTKYYHDDVDDNGNYHYGYFDAYFTERGREAYLIYENETLLGFAMLNQHSYIGHTPDWVIAEFCIFPSYRRRHFAIKASEHILEMHPGQWEIKFNENNIGAKALWEKVTSKYSTVIHNINEEETVLEFSNISNM